MESNWTRNEALLKSATTTARKAGWMARTDDGVEYFIKGTLDHSQIVAAIRGTYGPDAEVRIFTPAGRRWDLDTVVRKA